MKMGLLLSLLIICSTFAHGAGVANYKVVAVGCFPHGTCYIQIIPASTNTACPLKNQIRFDITLPGSNAQYSAALAAHTSGKTINVNLTDNCLDGYPIPDWLQINEG